MVFVLVVDRAISIVENALAIYGAPIYVRHEVVHNRDVVDSLRERGAIFIEQISESWTARHPTSSPHTVFLRRYVTKQKAAI